MTTILHTQHHLLSYCFDSCMFCILPTLHSIISHTYDAIVYTLEWHCIPHIWSWECYIIQHALVVHLVPSFISLLHYMYVITSLSYLIYYEHMSDLITSERKFEPVRVEIRWGLEDLSVLFQKFEEVKASRVITKAVCISEHGHLQLKRTFAAISLLLLLIPISNP